MACSPASRVTRDNAASSSAVALFVTVQQNLILVVRTARFSGAKSSGPWRDPAEELRIGGLVKENVGKVRAVPSLWKRPGRRSSASSGLTSGTSPRRESSEGGCLNKQNGHARPMVPAFRACPCLSEKYRTEGRRDRPPSVEPGTVDPALATVEGFSSVDAAGPRGHRRRVVRRVAAHAVARNPGSRPRAGRSRPVERSGGRPGRGGLRTGSGHFRGEPFRRAFYRTRWRCPHRVIGRRRPRGRSVPP